jgi:radical SAM protein with 4Fe4S-binding SPASM domain
MEWPGLDFNKFLLRNLTLATGLKKKFCKQPFTDISARPDGDVIICCYDVLGQHVIGNINDADLLSIWSGEAYRKLRKDMLAQDIGSLPSICKRCIHFTGHKLMIRDECN